MNPFIVPVTIAGTENLAEIVERMGMRGKMESRPVAETVEEILRSVRDSGDEALVEYTARFDHVRLAPGGFRVSGEEIEQACAAMAPAVMEALRRAADNVLSFHRQGLPAGFRRDDGAGAVTGVLIRPLDTVGIYVPGGTAPLPSSVLMNVLPARAAGVRRIVMCTPPSRDGSVHPAILAAARVAGATEIYRIGGAQAIAAMAYGTASIPRVDKICGPGNIYVNTAKRMVFGQVDIDLFAGPSEILVIADETADPEYIAADMLSQAEHDVLASAILVTTSGGIAKKTAECLRTRAALLPRRDIVERALADFAAILVVPDLDIAADFANALAPEHLEICTADPEALLPRIVNAGAVFLGDYSPEPLGDYFAGPNHVLPTSGTARFFSPLNASDFLKRINIIQYTRAALESCRADVELLAESEGLQAHAEAIRARFAR
ncbi:MAG TPA: histidinol dehydrogenase [Clostridia bacterium]